MQKHNSERLAQAVLDIRGNRTCQAIPYVRAIVEQIIADEALFNTLPEIKELREQNARQRDCIVDLVRQSMQSPLHVLQRAAA